MQPSDDASRAAAEEHVRLSLVADAADQSVSLLDCAAYELVEHADGTWTSRPAPLSPHHLIVARARVAGFNRYAALAFAARDQDRPPFLTRPLLTAVALITEPERIVWSRDARAKMRRKVDEARRRRLRNHIASL